MHNQVAVVTGAGRGIGFAISRTLLNHGAKVALLDYHLPQVEEVALLLDKSGENVIPLKVDVSEQKQVENAIGKIKETWGRIDAIVNNAGVHELIPLLELTDLQFERMLGINLLGTYHCTQTVLPTMVSQGGGSVVAISSVAGVLGSKIGAAHYSASKGAIIPFIRSIAREMGPSGIRANCIAPGLISTPMTAGFGEFEIDAYTKGIPLARIGKPEDIADAAVFLCSNASRYVTGQVLSVCGGALMA